MKLVEVKGSKIRVYFSRNAIMVVESFASVQKFPENIRFDGLRWTRIMFINRLTNYIDGFIDKDVCD